MNIASFWKIIEATRSDDRDTQYENLKLGLAKLGRDDLIAFDRHYRTQLNRAYHWDLWAAAYIINGGCSDDSFDYFCDWLISRGEIDFEAALKDPESLASVAQPDETDFEEFRYAMGEVFEEKFKEELPWDKSLMRSADPAGDAWDEDTVEDKYPALAKLVEDYEPAALSDTSKPTQKSNSLSPAKLIRILIAVFILALIAMNLMDGK